MAIRFACCYCNRRLVAQYDAAGTTVECPKCERLVIVPGLQEAGDSLPTSFIGCAVLILLPILIWFLPAFLISLAFRISFFQTLGGLAAVIPLVFLAISILM